VTSETSDTPMIVSRAGRIDQQFALLKQRLHLSLDLEAMDQNPARGDFERRVRDLVVSEILYGEGDRYRRLWKGIISDAATLFPVVSSWEPPRSVSTTPDTDAVARRCTRVISMVHELHKAGYQRIRLLPHMAPSGMYWRCAITHSENVEADGCSVKAGYGDGEHVAVYSSSTAASYFDIPDSETMSARDLALAFLDRFPVIAERGVGIDWAYAGWLTDVLGKAEQGGACNLVYLYADWEVEPDYLRRWRPPAPC